ncbi:uncharacterized protein LOC128966516 [Oppia nitens]|uniref:uncharacterized protein LOC128966516 n=1 Tax=Oppia nitens TaxID=1686743 RepID=UPI0023DA35D0|nr:uncharacterized protein LOC128966516 [Oppia nitens]
MSHVVHRGSHRCYICSWSIVQCSDFNCYNNPDICTNNNFSPSLVQQADCPAGCEQFVITDPNGIVQQWRRNCAPGNIPVIGFNCKTEYQLGVRVDRCVCNKNWCNSSLKFTPNAISSTNRSFDPRFHYKRSRF